MRSSARVRGEGLPNGELHGAVRRRLATTAGGPTGGKPRCGAGSTAGATISTVTMCLAAAWAKAMAALLLVAALAELAAAAPATAPPTTAPPQQAVAPLRVMTFNIRYSRARDGENSWPKRREQLFQLIRDEAPHLIGLQEALRDQLDQLAAALPEYGEVAVGRDDGKSVGECAAILYDRRRIEVLASETFWFAPQPAGPGTTAWGANIPRVCTWIHARDRATGRTFFHYNLHWDHQSQLARVNSAALLLDRIAARTPADDPVIVTGDFNANEANPAFLKLLDDPRVPLVDSFRRLHPNEREVNTFHDFKGGNVGSKIDAVLISPAWRVESAAILRNHQNNRYPSDHYPVVAVLELAAANGPTK